MLYRNLGIIVMFIIALMTIEEYTLAESEDAPSNADLMEKTIDTDISYFAH